jgi:hypothetical protein
VLRVRTDPPRSGSEAAQLPAFLDFLRATVVEKCAGLDAAGLAQRVPTSALTLGGLLNHLALVEDWWFRVRFLGLEHVAPWGGIDWDADPDWEFRTAADTDPDELRGRYLAACERSREVVRSTGGLDRLSVAASADGERWDLRWVLLHMIEETARHAGHADLLREAVDGRVGE